MVSDTFTRQRAGTPVSQLPFDAGSLRGELFVAEAGERPGVLRGGAVLVLQTRQAQRLVKGRSYRAEKPAIIGLIGFANLARSVWQGARADDPYADWWMLKIHDALEDAERTILSMERVIATQLEAADALEVAAPASIQPVRISLNFSNPYAFRAARLLGIFDTLACKILGARHVGLLARSEAEGMLHQSGRALRRVLQSPVRYRFSGVTRHDVEQGTARALQAREAMGEVPADVLAGTRRAPYAPAIPNSRRAIPVPNPSRSQASVNFE
jgi:integrating conjugative element protein (TIGR03761 family)